MAAGHKRHPSGPRSCEPTSSHASAVTRALTDLPHQARLGGLLPAAYRPPDYGHTASPFGVRTTPAEPESSTVWLRNTRIDRETRRDVSSTSRPSPPSSPTRRRPSPTRRPCRPRRLANPEPVPPIPGRACRCSAGVRRSDGLGAGWPGAQHRNLRPADNRHSRLLHGYWFYKTHDEMKRHTGDGLGGGIALLWRSWWAS
jgi:hypothetical protein